MQPFFVSFSSFVLPYVNFVVCGNQAASFAASVDLEAPDTADDVGAAVLHAGLGRLDEGADHLRAGEVGEEADINKFV